MLPIAGDEEIASVLAVDDFREDEYLVLLTQVSGAAYKVVYWYDTPVRELVWAFYFARSFPRCLFDRCVESPPKAAPVAWPWTSKHCSSSRTPADFATASRNDVLTRVSYSEGVPTALSTLVIM